MKQKSSGPEPKVRVFLVEREDVGGWAQAASLQSYDISADLLKKHGELVSKTEPDIFAVLLMHLTKAAREVLKI